MGEQSMLLHTRMKGVWVAALCLAILAVGEGLDSDLTSVVELGGSGADVNEVADTSFLKKAPKRTLKDVGKIQQFKSGSPEAVKAAGQVAIDQTKDGLGMTVQQVKAAYEEDLRKSREAKNRPSTEEQVSKEEIAAMGGVPAGNPEEEAAKLEKADMDRLDPKSPEGQKRLKDMTERRAERAEADTQAEEDQKLSALQADMDAAAKIKFKDVSKGPPPPEPDDTLSKTEAETKAEDNDEPSEEPAKPESESESPVKQDEEKAQTPEDHDKAMHKIAKMDKPEAEKAETPDKTENDSGNKKDSPAAHDKAMQDEMDENNRKANDPDGPEQHDKKMHKMAKMDKPDEEKAEAPEDEEKKEEEEEEKKEDEAKKMHEKQDKDDDEKENDLNKEEEEEKVEREKTKKKAEELKK